MVRMGPALARIGQPSSAMAGPAIAAAPSGSFFVCPFENAVYFLSHIGSAHVEDINEFFHYSTELGSCIFAKVVVTAGSIQLPK